MQTRVISGLFGYPDLWAFPPVLCMSRGQHGGRGKRSSRGQRDRYEEPFEMDPRERRGRRNSLRVGRGDVRAATLLLLAEQPAHGYQIIQQVSERSAGRWQPSPGSVYPALQLLEDEGLVRAEQQEGRRVFCLTEAGRTYVQQHRDTLQAAWDAVIDTGDGEEQTQLHELVHQIGRAAAQVAHEGTTAQIASAHDLLVRTRRQLYLILAGDESTPDK
jgi:DNA-binding PadR family transcriptional regulator